MREYPFRAIGGAAAIADGETVSLLGLFLAAPASRNRFQLLIDGIYLMSGSLSAVSGVGIQVSLRRLSALTDGTAGAVRLMNPESEAVAALAAQVTCVTGGTATAAANGVFGYRALNNDENSLTGQGDVVERCIWRPARPDDALVVKGGEGVDILQVTASTAGAWIPEIAGRLRIG